jgi:dCTP deaminase
MVKPDYWIRKMSLEKGMIEPFEEGLVRQGMISFGVSAYGYDMRISDEFKLWQGNGVVDPKVQSDDMYKNVKCDVLELEPNSTALGRTVEYFRIPRDVLAICYGKSTYARCGVFFNITPLEPEWEGYITVSIVNTNRYPVKLYAGEGIAQVLFIAGDGVCEKSYADKKGKYQSQKDITVSRVDSL